MVNDLRNLMHENVASPPPDQLDVASVLEAGRRRVRTRRTAWAGSGVAAAAVVSLVAVAAVGSSGNVDRTASPAGPPTPDAPTLRLADAQQAVAGRDYRELASYTNDNLNRDNGQYFDGVTDDGLILFRDGPRTDQLFPRFAILDPATGEKDWLPKLDVGQSQTWPVELSSNRLVLLAGSGGRKVSLVAYVFDRETREWSTQEWPTLPRLDSPGGQVGPDGRLYVSVPATRGQPPEGGWPTQPGGDAEDAGAHGDTFDLWSVSLTDPTDARDEHLRMGDLAFTRSSMVWTDASNGSAGMVHVRDLSTGDERAFDPHTGERCNLLSFGATDDRIMMGQYCGTYADGGRDDRVQILTTDGDQVVTIQDSSIEGWLPSGSDVVSVSVYGAVGDDRSGTYVYDLASDRFLRVSDGLSQWGLDGPVGTARQFMWHTPVNHGDGARQHLGQLLP